MPIFNSLKSLGVLGAKRIMNKLGAFQDTFTRSNSANSLAGDGAASWTQLSGVWGVNSNSANSSTAASSYPVAVFDAKTKDVVVKSSGAGTGAGYGASFWVTDANNWWGVYTEKTTFNAAPYNCPSGGTAYGSNCNYGYGASGGPYAYPYCNAGTTFGAQCYNCCWVLAGGAAWGFANAAYSCPSGGSLSGSTCYVTYGGTVSTWYKNDYKVIKNTSGTVTLVDTVNVGNSLTQGDSISYVQANTQPSSVIITSQMSTGGSVATSSHSAGTPDRSTLHGMIVGPATLSQTSETTTFDYNPN